MSRSRQNEEYRPVDNPSYVDFYLSTTPGNPAFVGNRSVVIFSGNGGNTTTLACANFTMNGLFSTGISSYSSGNAATLSSAVAFVSSVASVSTGPIYATVNLGSPNTTLSGTGPGGV